ncbi:MAG TPA: Flp pilus assembly protein CpaB [Clostridia bacterium]|nr:Flp pilus assembly protein CpaB [Clostridia bacterium]
MSSSGPGVGRPRRGRIYIVVGTILAVVAFGTAAAVASLPLLSSSTTGTKVVVAKNTIAARTRIQASDLELKTITPTPPESFTDLATVAGKGARVDIPAGSPVTANLITLTPDQLGSGDNTFLPIPSGYVAVTVPTSEQVGVAGYVQVGDRIIVLATISTSAFGPGPSAPVVRTVFRDLNVIRVGPPATAQSGSASGQLTSSLTVIVTACDAEYLFWLLNNAILKYELESFKDYGTAPTTPDSSCPTIASAGGVGPVEVNKKWHFTTP